MKKLTRVVATLIATMVMVVSYDNADAKAENKGKKQPPTTMQAKQVVQDEACVEEADPCAWKAPAKSEPKTNSDAYYGVPIPAPALRGLDTSVLDQTEEQQREAAIAKGFANIKFAVKSGKQWEKKAASCAMLCLVKQSYYIEAKRLADKYGVVTAAINKLASNEEQMDDLNEKIDEAAKRFDTGEMSVLTRRLKALDKEQDKILAKIKSVGSCESKPDPWSCFKKRIDWKGAFQWAKAGDLKRQAAVNACFKAITTSFGRGCHIDFESGSLQPMVVGCNRTLLPIGFDFNKFLERYAKGLSSVVEVKRGSEGENPYACTPRRIIEPLSHPIE